MYNILIVDDEKIIRIGMRTIIDWETYGFRVADIVSNGEEALQVIEEQDIDLVITDIKMPKLDGIQLVQKLKERAFTGQIIMLTSYGEFDLARDCLRYGVHDYLLKGTLRSSELIKALEGVRPKLSKKAAQPVKEQVQDNEEEYEALQDIAKGVLSGQAEEVKGIVFSHAYQLLLIKQIKSKFEQEMEGDRCFKDYSGAIQNIVAEIFPKKTKTLVMFEGDWCIYNLPIPGEMGQQDLLKISLKIQNLIKLYTNIRVIGVIGRPIYTSYDEVDSLKKCMKVAGIAFYNGYQDVLKEEMIHSIKDYKIKENDQYENKIYETVKKGNYTESIHALEAYITYLRSGYIPQQQVEQLLNNVLQRVILDYNIYLEKDKEHLNNIIDQYRKCTLLEELHALINELIYIICTFMEQVRDKHYRKEIVEIMNYIEDHIGERITLTSIASQVNMNESYVSRLFKHETGMNIINYINICKMEKAKELLGKENMIVKDVAYALGFEEQSYFNRMFNKYFGVNPKEYKKCIKLNTGKSN